MYHKNCAFYQISSNIFFKRCLTIQTYLCLYYFYLLLLFKADSYFCNIIRYLQLIKIYLQYFNPGMIDQMEYFQKGVVYRIKNKKTKRCLAVCSKRDLKAIEEEDSCDQLWIIRYVKTNQYEIEHFKLGSAMTYFQNKKIYTVEMKKDKEQQNQQWNIILGQSFDNINYFWIKPTLNLDITLCSSNYNDIIKISEIDQTLNICLWEFIPYLQLSPVLKLLTTIKADSSKLIITVPEYSSKEGTNLIQMPFCGGGNQRWLVQPCNQYKQDSKQFTIRNYSSGLHLTASFKKGISKVIQSIYNSSADQKWNLLNLNNNIFLIQSVSNPSYYLGVINQKGGNPIYLLQDRMKAKWILEGYFPTP